MKAIRVHSTGGPEVLALEDIARPSPKRGEALVKIEAAGVNFIDCYFRTGAYPAALPLTSGSEGAGTVVEVGEDVTAVKAGDRVASVGLAGSYAELALAPAEKLVLVPPGVSTKHAAAPMLQGRTRPQLTPPPLPLPKVD